MTEVEIQMKDGGVVKYQDVDYFVSSSGHHCVQSGSFLLDAWHPNRVETVRVYEK